MGESLILTFDIGTTGNKCSLFSEKGETLYTKTVAYNTVYPRAGWAEQNPEHFWESVVTGTRALLDMSGICPASIAAIGLSGHMNGCIPVDAEGNVLFNDIIHSDSRSTKECDDVLKVMDSMAYYNITGNRLDSHYTFPKILWLKKNYPEIYKKTALFLASKDYISFKLTGNLGITDYSDASMTGMLDINRKCWAKELVGQVGIEHGKLPELRKSYDIAGYVSAEAASILGLRQGTPVTVGGGDAACAAKGAGVMERLQAYNYIGSSSWISFLHDRPILDQSARVFNFYDLDGENCNVCGTVQCATVSYDWVLNNIAKHEVEECKRNRTNVFDYMDGLAQKVPIGSNGVLFLPYLMGERSPLWDENTRGGFIGFSLYNKREDLFRATYEGIAYALRSVLDVFEENGLCPDTLTLIGGGAKSLLWNEIMCNVYGKRLMVRKHPREAASLGTAIAAGVGVGIFSGFREANAVIEYERVLEPEADKVSEYNRFYKIYRMMYPSLKAVFSEMAAL